MGMITCLHAIEESRLPSIEGNEAAFMDFTENDSTMLDLDKAWHGLHFLLTGSVADGNPPLDFLLVGGRGLNGTDGGYGPARYFTPLQTRDLAVALTATSRTELEARYDADAMTEEGIYPSVWDSEDQGVVSWLGETFVETQEWVSAAAEAGKGMIVVLF